MHYSTPLPASRWNAALVLALGCVLLLAPAPARATARTVAAGDDLQAALDAAQPGDTLLLEAGATFVGPFTLPAKSGDDWITIRTAAPDAALPSGGERIAPDDAPLLPKLVSQGAGEPALRTAPGAHHYRLLGLEIAQASRDALIYDLVMLGNAEQKAAEVPHHLIIDRAYIHTFGDAPLKRGVQLSSASTEIRNSYIAGFKSPGQDSQAIAGWNGPGPFKIINNYLEGASENLMFGGAPPSIPGLVPTDIEIRDNHFFKPLSWRGGGWAVKNLFEIKNARAVTITNNLFENNWADGQSGIAILLRGGADSGRQATCEDIRFANNVVRHAGGGVHIIGLEDPEQVDPGFGACRRVEISNNLFEDISTRWGGGAMFVQLIAGPTDVTVDRNTVFHEGNVITVEGVTRRLRFTNNILAHNEYGVIGAGLAPGNPTITALFPDVVFARNVIAGANPNNYPPDNFYPPSLDDVRFVDRAAANYRLAADSPYKGQATDGGDVGYQYPLPPPPRRASLYLPCLVGR